MTTNAGYPLDQNLYQAVKGMSAGMTVVKPGGTIVCAAECRDGFPDHGSYREVLASEPSPRRCSRRSRRGSAPCPTSGRCRCRPRSRRTRDVVVRSSYLSADDLASAHLGHTDDVAETVLRALHDAGPDARVCVLPEGPQTIPYVEAART